MNKNETDNVEYRHSPLISPHSQLLAFNIWRSLLDRNLTKTTQKRRTSEKRHLQYKQLHQHRD